MTDPVPQIAPAFRRLRRALLVRRFRRLDPVLRVELALLAALGTTVIAWKVRLPLDALARAHGAAAVGATLGAGLAACVAIGATAAGADQARRLRRRPAGPEWLALPLSPRAIAAQSAWESSWHALWTLPAALGLLAAAMGLVPWWTLVLLGAAFLAMILNAGHGGAALATRLAARRPSSAAHPAPDRLLERLFAVASLASAARVGPARWRAGAGRALLLHDLARTRRRTPARPRAAAWAALVLLAAAVWALPLEPAAAGVFSAALALAAAATLADWMIALSAGDPYTLLAALPLRARRVWALRAALVAAATAVTVFLLALAARALEPGARAQAVAALGLATLLIGVLGVTYGATLFPRVETAQRLVLLGALAHALRRLRLRVTLAADVVAGEPEC